MVKIRLRRFGKKNTPVYRVVVADGRSPRDGRIIEEIGTYDPLLKNNNFTLNLDRVDYWLGVGAQASDTVNSFIKKARKGPVEVADEEPAAEAVEPRDIMVLMPSRTHMDDLVHRLTALGVPALADQEGGLLDQPVVLALMALVQMVARPHMPFNAAALSRSPLIGHSDLQLQEYLLDENGDEDLLASRQDTSHT